MYLWSFSVFLLGHAAWSKLPAVVPQGICSYLDYLGWLWYFCPTETRCSNGGGVKFGVVQVRTTGQGNDFELIPMVKIETRHPIEGSFGSEFQSICNHCRVMVAWSHKMLKKIKKFLQFLEKRPLTVKFAKFCSESFRRNINVLCSNFMKFGQRENRWNRVLLTWQKIRLAVQQSLLRGLCPKFAMASPRQCTQCSRFHPTWFTFGGVTAEHVNTAKMCRKVDPIFDWSLASSRIITFRGHWR